MSNTRAILISCLIFVLLTGLGYAQHEGIDEDYFFGKASFRSGNIRDCNSFLYQYFCSIKCGKKTGVCYKNQCFCIQKVDIPNSLKTGHAMPTGHLNIKPKQIDFEDYEELDGVGWKKYIQQPTNDRQVLRHHIAHFCPNLDVARACIRECLKLGKPAFCGKDHVCYCGHKGRGKEEEIKVEDVQNQFSDLYEKYFGPNDDNHETHIAENHNDDGPENDK